MSNPHKIQRILLIDDSPDDRARFRGALLRGAPDRRYHIKEADSGDEALKLCQPDPDWPIDCIVTDIHMPRMDGFELLRALQVEDEHFLQVPVIVLTGTADQDDDAKEALRLGAQDYITKNSLHHTTLFRSIDNAIERHALVAQLRESERAAEEATRAKSALIGNISHEIRTPMTAVLGLCDVLLSEDVPQQHRPMLQMIRDNGSYLVEIVNDLLDLSKIEAGMLEIEPTSVLLSDFLKDLMQLMQVRASENETSLELHTNDLPYAIESDAVRLRQILLNLLGNAIKFSPQGKVSLSVNSEQKDGRPVLRFKVEDTGCGIPADDLDAIFHPFIQSASSSKTRSSGTGLGLSICRKLCEAMNGRISVESEVNVGSVFTVILPLIPAEATSQTAQADVKQSLDGILNNRRILVAEDTRATQVLLRHFLEKAGAEVTIVDDGAQLLETAKENHNGFDLILSDVQMPNVGGLEATKMIRQSGSKIPVIVLTADALSDTRDLALQNGASDVITKPIDRAALLKKIARLIRKSQRNS